jgi:peptidoglycan-associated lipoprotein
MISMRMTVLALLGSVLLVVGCESAPTDGAAADAGQAAASAPAGAVAGRELGAPRPGTSEDFAVNAGDRVFFDFDRHDLSAEARATLQKQALWLRRFPGVSIAIEGHCDERGTREYNLALGERRANAVREYLRALGVEAARMKTISYGKERPVAPGSNEDAWKQNRRAVSVVSAGPSVAGL